MSDPGWYNCGILFRLTLPWFALVALLQHAFIYAFMLNDTTTGSNFAQQVSLKPVEQNS